MFSILQIASRHAGAVQHKSTFFNSSDGPNVNQLQIAGEGEPAECAASPPSPRSFADSGGPDQKR